MIANQAIGATLANLNTNIIRRISIKYPPFHNQRQIVTILANYDSLIENNIQRIKLLEQMAKLIYDEWFIKFKFPGHEHVKMVDSGTDLGKIPEDWELNGIMDIDYFSFISNNIDKFDGEKEYLATANIDGINIIKEGEKVSFTNKPSRAQKQPSINSVWFARMKDTYKVLGFTRSNWRIADSCILSSGFAGFESDELVFPFLYYTINSKKFHELKDMYATGATQVSLNNEALSQIKIIKPSLEIVNLFGDKILPFINEIFILQIINKNLSKTRDLLLPKLMSGEIDISELDIKVSGVNI
jgi:type I restriction enzyme S subunit